MVVFLFLCKMRFFAHKMFFPGNEIFTVKPLFLGKDDFFGDGKVGLWFSGFSDDRKKKLLSFFLVFLRRIIQKCTFRVSENLNGNWFLFSG